jgi:hypothetical protein
MTLHQPDLYSVLQSSTEGIDTEFKSARGDAAGDAGECVRSELSAVSKSGPFQ